MLEAIDNHKIAQGLLTDHEYTRHEIDRGP